MRFPKMRRRVQTREFVQEFLGLDRRLRIKENAFAEMRNLSGDCFPALSPRKPRGIVRNDMEGVSSVVVCGKIAYVKNNVLCWGLGDDAVTMQLRADVNEPRQLAVMGAYITVFPDAMYLNTTDTADQGSFHAEYDLTGAQLELITPMRLDGVEIDQKKIFLSAQKYVCVDGNGCCLFGVPNNDLSELSHYKLTSENLTLVKRAGEAYVYVDPNGVSETNMFGGSVTVYNTNTGDTVTHYVEVWGSEGFEQYSVPDIKIGYWLTSSGVKRFYYDAQGNITESAVTSSVRVRSKFFESFPNGTLHNFTFNHNSSRITANIKAADVICKGGAVNLSGAYLTDTVITVNNEDNCTCECDVSAPNMDFVIESQNRLWGCRHGTDAIGNTVNEIYASALGSFSEWYRFQGVSTDSFAASVGHVGDFTGAISYRGMPLFFKENVMYKIYGDYPENFQIVSDESTGLQAGCAKSLAVLSGLLYYRSNNGFFVYDGSAFSRVDHVLGKERYENVVCGGVGTKLYVSATCEQEKHSGLYVYDTERDLWHMEDSTQVTAMVPYENDLYFLNKAGQLCTVNGSAGAKEAYEISFFAESGVIGYSTPDAKYVSRLALRAAIPLDAYLHVYMEYDSSGEWEFKGSIEGNGMSTFVFPVVPRMCDHFRIRFEGKGNCRIFGFSKVLEDGGAV